jgi:hypothetical protein
MTLKKIVTHEKSPYYWGLGLTVVCAGFALGLPGEVGGLLTIVGLAFYGFRAKLK